MEEEVWRVRRQARTGGDSTGRGAGPGVQAQEPEIQWEAEGSSLRISAWKLLSAPETQAKSTLHRCGKAARERFTASTTAQGVEFSRAQNSRSMRSALTTALKDGH